MDWDDRFGLLRACAFGLFRGRTQMEGQQDRGVCPVVSNGCLFVFRRLELAMMQYIRIHMIISTDFNHSVLLVFLITSS